MKSKKRSFFLVKMLMQLLFVGSLFQSLSISAKNEYSDTKLLQEKTISGTVNDNEGLPLPGATIAIKGSTKGTISDFDGNFSIIVPSDDTILLVSFVGFKTKEVLVGNQSQININLEPDANALDEVVVVGYGTQKKASISGSISSIDGEELEKNPAPNLTNSIAGQMSGVIANVRDGEPGKDNADILIRGKSTLGDNSALVVIDGIPDRGGFARLNPEDIESFTVLKDASAAIYGARAANGVILITTKRGKTGKPQFNISSSAGWSQPTRLPHFLDSYSYAIAENEYRNNFKGEQPRWSADDLEKFRTGSSPLTHPNTDWFDVMFKDWSAQSNQTISLRGGSEKVKYFLSGQYLSQDGNFHEGTKYEQFQYRANLDVKVTNNLSAAVDLSYRLEDKNFTRVPDGNSMWYGLKSTYPYLVDYYPNGLPGTGTALGSNMAIMSTFKSGYQREKTHIYNTKLDLKYDLSKLAEGLYVQGYTVLDQFNNDNRTFRKTWSEYAYNEATQEYEEYTIPFTRNLSVYKGNSRSTTLHARLGFDRRFGDHKVSTFVAYEQNKYYSDYLSGYRDGFISDNVDQLFAGDNGDNRRNNGNASQSGRLNYFGRINYDYKGKYLVDFTLRHDGSQNFPKGKRFGTFPGVSVGWRVSEESFFNPNTINNLKIRASIGKMGNDLVGAYQYLETYKLGIAGNWVNEVAMFGLDGTQVNTLSADQTPNPNITWETATTSNIGIDMTLFGSKLGISADAFYSRRKNILIARNASVPLYTGLTLPLENLGIVDNKGIELEMTFKDVIGDEFNYFIKGNFTFARNKVVFMDEPVGTPDIQKREGYPIDSWLIYESDGLFQTQDEVDNYPVISPKTGPGDVKLVDTNNDGDINGLDKRRITSGQTPEIMYGISFGGSYKNFDLSVLFQGQARAYKMVTPGTLNVYPEFFDGRWKEEGDNDYPRTFYGPTTVDGQSIEASDFWLKNASFIRLKNVQLAYNFPKSLSSKIGIDNMRIYVSGSNLFTVDKIKLFDPELVSDGVSYPLQRIISMGINLSL